MVSLVPATFQALFQTIGRQQLLIETNVPKHWKMASTKEKYSQQEAEMGMLGQVFLEGARGLLRRGHFSSLPELKSVLRAIQKGNDVPREDIQGKGPEAGAHLATRRSKQGKGQSVWDQGAKGKWFATSSGFLFLPFSRSLTSAPRAARPATLCRLLNRGSVYLPGSYQLNSLLSECNLSESY